MAKGTRGGKRAVADTSYQGNRGYAKASSTGYAVSDMADRLSKLKPRTLESNPDAVRIINAVHKNPNATVTIYRATVGDTINQGDWVFLDRAHAERWAAGLFGRPKPGVKVITKTVKARDVDWTGKNLEFMLNTK